MACPSTRRRGVADEAMPPPPIINRKSQIINSVILVLDEVTVADQQQAVEAAILEGQVPFRARPRAVGLPPVAAAAPRAANLADHAVETLRENIGRLPAVLLQFDGGRQRRTKAA